MANPNFIPNRDDPLSALLEASEPSMMMDTSVMHYDDAGEESRMDMDNVLGEIEDEEKWQTIETWLRRFYPPPGPLPPFEKTPETLRRIHHLYLMHRQREETTRICIAELKRGAEEYRDQARRLRELHEAAGIRREDLSKQGEMALQTLTSVACTLGLRDVKLSSYQCALTNLTIESAEVEMERDRLAGMMKTVETRTAEAKTKLEKLQGLLAQAQYARDNGELDRIKEQKANTQVLNSKAQEYVKKLEEVEQQYAATGIEQAGLRYPALRQLEEAIDQIERDLAARQKVLKGYKDLPPDISLAKLKVAEAQERLMMLTQERERMLATIADSVQ